MIIVGTSSEWETEGNDRASMDLPGDQVQLIEAVCAANPRTCVVVNAGSAVDMTWSKLPAAVLYGWLGGQEMAAALIDVLFGDAAPGGRLPITLPERIEHTPAYGTFPGESNDTLYAERNLIGYRWYDTRHIAPRYEFGYGLSYTTFDWSTPQVVFGDGLRCVVELEVTNTGDRAGSDVVQVYLSGPQSAFLRAANQLVGATKVHLDPGESQSVSVQLVPRSFAIWDPANKDHITAIESLGGSTSGVGVSGGSSDAAEPGWYVEPGDYAINVARSIGQVHASLPLAVETLVGPLQGEDSLP